MRSLVHASEDWTSVVPNPRDPGARLSKNLNISAQDRRLPRYGSNRNAGIILPAALPRRQLNVQNSHIHRVNRSLKPRSPTGLIDPDSPVINSRCRLITMLKPTWRVAVDE
jgi:hypothetical protein